MEPPTNPGRFSRLNTLGFEVKFDDYVRPNRTYRDGCSYLGYKLINDSSIALQSVQLLELIS